MPACVAELLPCVLNRPVEEGAEGERVRIEVGPVGSRELRTFVFTKVRGRWRALRAG